MYLSRLLPTLQICKSSHSQSSVQGVHFARTPHSAPKMMDRGPKIIFFGSMLIPHAQAQEGPGVVQCCGGTGGGVWCAGRCDRVLLGGADGSTGENTSATFSQPSLLLADTTGSSRLPVMMHLCSHVSGLAPSAGRVRTGIVRRQCVLTCDMG